MRTEPHRTEIVDAGQLADVLNVTPETVRKWARQGLIPYLQITPRVMRFELGRVIHMLRQHSKLATTREQVLTLLGREGDGHA